MTIGLNLEYKINNKKLTITNSYRMTTCKFLRILKDQIYLKPHLRKSKWQAQDLQF